MGTVVLSTGLFLFGINNANINVPRAFSNFGTRYSMLIFLLHCSIGYIIQQYERLYDVDLDNYLPIVVIICTVIISTIIIFIKNIIKKTY